MPDIMIKGIPISFPFEPYDVQRAYMEKVIECLQNGHNGVLESPTGTGKTLCLLCSSLAWLLVKKAQVQLNAQGGFNHAGNFTASLEKKLKNVSGKQTKNEGSSWGLPKIIYASRTHSQISQAMQELKRSNYRHVKATVLGSREQMCIHPKVSKETNHTVKSQLCQVKVKSKTCFFYENVESKKDDASVRDGGILDIEDLVGVGKKLKCCPYYLSKELKQTADIVFMPYNYLLDHKSRKANGIELANNIIILDEGHNIEKMCEDLASMQFRTTDIALCIEEVTHVMKSLVDNQDDGADFTSSDNSQPKDFTPDDLCTLKVILLALEKAVDEIAVTPGEGITFDGSYIFDLLAKAQINNTNCIVISSLIENLVQYLIISSGDSPFQRKGNGLQKLADLFNIAFSSIQQQHKEKVSKCYKVHIQIEDKTKKSDSWAVIKSNAPKSAEKVVSYWCFSPGFGMKQLLEQHIRSVILTSGTLAPLKPLISELGIPINVRLENPHIVKKNQIFVKIISQGPDAQVLNSNYENRNNPKYISSLGRTILSFCRVIPDGLLIFFPSYPILAKCQQDWQMEGIWGNISDIKPIFVEPQRKDTFNTIMTDFYSKINDPTTRGACFMAVCRGKVSEGLDFADMNGRAVIITGLPFTPLKDPRILLKKKYLDEQRSRDKDYLSGDEWYSLEASRAVNQAIGRVIRHKNDYGAILLCDTRFNNPRLKSNLSSWLKDHITVGNKFGETVGELCRFFKNAEKELPSPRLKPLIPIDYNELQKFSGEYSSQKSNIRAIPKRDTANTAVSTLPNSNDVLSDYYKNCKTVENDEASAKKSFDLFSALDKCNDKSLTGETSSAKRPTSYEEQPFEKMEAKNKKKKLKILPFGFDSQPNQPVSCPKILEPSKKAPESLLDFVKCIKAALDKNSYKEFQTSISTYRTSDNFNEFIGTLDKIFFPIPNTHYLLKDMGRFLKNNHKQSFDEYCEKLT